MPEAVSHLNSPIADPDRLTLHQGLRTAIAAGLACWVARLLHLPGDYWAAISAIIVMQSDVGATIIASRDRFAGTAIGSVAGWIASIVWHNYLASFAVAVFVVMVVCTALHFRNAGRLGGVTVAIIVLTPHTTAAWHIALERFVEVSLGIVVSLLVAEIGKKRRMWIRRSKT